MRSGGRMHLATGLVVLAAMAVTGALAWACTPAASLTVVPEFGPPGAQVRITADSFDRNNGPVQIHWNSSDGQVLGSGQAPAFSVWIRLPDVAPGVYYVVAIQKDLLGQVAGKASAPVSVRSASQAGSPGGGSGSSSPGTTSGVVSGGSTQPAPSGAEAGGPAPDGAPAGGQSAGGTAPAAPPSPGSPQSGVGLTTPASIVAPPAGPAASSATPAASSRRPESAAAAAGAATGVRPAQPAGDAGPAQPAQPAVADMPDAPENGSPVPSLSSVSDDLWSGFDFSAPTEGRSLFAQERSQPATLAGAMMLAAGLVALAGGFAAAEVSRARRRRAARTASAVHEQGPK